ncbi:hypothetical protein HR12_48290 [Microbacterium sp. SUBG005]|nr:hypothetical protein HR12_48290 [Microbacterium sp. SUBG005]
MLSRARMSFWKKIAWPALIFATLFQLLVYVPGLGIASYGNRNWVQIAGFQFQPAEFLKLALALWMGRGAVQASSAHLVEARLHPRSCPWPSS